MDPQEARKIMGDKTKQVLAREIWQLKIKANVKMINKLYHIYENTNYQETRSILNNFGWYIAMIYIRSSSQQNACGIRYEMNIQRIRIATIHRERFLMAPISQAIMQSDD
jgi:hypothetical protein